VRKKMLIFFIALIFALIIIICPVISFLAWLSDPGEVARELHQEEIRPMLKRITGRELPAKVEDLRAIFYYCEGLENLLVAYQTDEEGCLYALDAFGGQDVKKEQFPRVGFRVGSSGFDKAYFYQKRLGLTLFDENLIDRLRRDYTKQITTRRFPKDAVTGWYLEFNTISKLYTYKYKVLIFKDLGIVYIYASKEPEGVFMR